MSDGYESYEDWYDDGSGSENFKRAIAKSESEFLKNASFPALVGCSLCEKRGSLSKKKKNSIKALSEQIEALDKKLKADVKLSPNARINKGLLEEIVKNSRRLLRYMEELEND